MFGISIIYSELKSHIVFFIVFLKIISTSLFMINIRSLKRLQFYKYTDCYISTFNHCLMVFNPTDKQWLNHSLEALLKISSSTRCFLRFPNLTPAVILGKETISPTHIFIPVVLKQAAHTHRIRTRWDIISRPLGYCQREGRAAGREKANVASSYFYVNVCGWITLLMRLLITQILISTTRI